MIEASFQNSSFILEEVLQLLCESLEHDPFNQSSYQPTKQHITTLRNLLGQEFSFLLAETGNLFFSALVCTKPYLEQVFTLTTDSEDAIKLYNLLQHTSQLIMGPGLQSEQTTDVLLKLNNLVTDESSLTQDAYTVINATLRELQRQVYSRITI